MRGTGSRRKKREIGGNHSAIGQPELYKPTDIPYHRKMAIEYLNKISGI